MQFGTLPPPGPRYWTGIALASVFGTNMGDFVSGVLHLGHLRGLPPLAALLVAVLLCERWSRFAGEAFYWIAIVVVRTSATNLADLATHDLKLGYPLVVAGLSLFMVLMVRPRGAPGRPQTGADGTRPAADGRYWAIMLVAGTLGTSLGDLVDDGLHVGTGTGSVVLGTILMLVLGWRRRVPTIASFWLAILAARTAGTAVGDFLAGSEGLHLGLTPSTALTGLAFVGTLLLWRQPATIRPRRAVSARPVLLQDAPPAA